MATPTKTGKEHQEESSNAGGKPGLRKPVFTKVDLLKPGTGGHTLTVKVLNSIAVLPKGRSVSHHLRQSRIAECLIGDDTGSIIFTARNEQGSFFLSLLFIYLFLKKKMYLHVVFFFFFLIFGL
jgi:replication factor A1